MNGREKKKGVKERSQEGETELKKGRRKKEYRMKGS